MFALDGKKPLAAFGLGYFLGVLFFAGTVYWLIHVTFAGVIVLILYMGVYFALFGLGYSLMSRLPRIEKLFVLPSIWIAVEFIRSRMFTGFDWASLGYSQYKNLFAIQIADITGVFGVSFLVVMVNFIIKEAIDAFLKKEIKKIIISAFVVTTITTIVLGYGLLRLNEELSFFEDQKKIAIVQGNIRQEDKWNPYFSLGIVNKYLGLTEDAAKESPDMVIWPETSFPRYLWEDPELFEEVKSAIARIGVPVVLGAVRKDYKNYYNSAFLISDKGQEVKIYDKLHLVIFGEYIPWRGILPFLEDIVPIADFTPGEEYTLFPVDENNSLGILICFEDTIARISRGFVNNGAQLLVNITNDAWFKDTIEPFLHQQGSVFRAVENRKTVIRAANTGVSCFINSYGRIYSTVQSPTGKSTYIDGYSVAKAGFNDKITFYTKFGDVFTYLCFGCILMGIIRTILK